MSITSHPLYWPDGWARNKSPQRSRFGDHSNKKAIDLVISQIEMMGCPSWNIIISTNLTLKNDGLPYSSQKEPDDSGVSVWWRHKDHEDDQKVIAVDDWSTCAENLWAIAKTLEAMRGIDRWSSSEIITRTFKGFTALPDQSKRSWRDVLMYYGDNINEAKVNYRKLRSEHHSDKGGNDANFNKIQEAWEQAKEELG